ncbi:MAG: formylmethanofuran--tetrahydromethanopterin N-formyltransferase [Candidatus Hydrothermarchaeales archaeon]
MQVNGVEIEDTYAEAFTGFFSRLLVTAINEKWANIASAEMTGYGTSIIGASAEAGVEKCLGVEETPDNRPGCVVQIWTSKKRMPDELLGRIGQCVLTSPTAAVWNYLDSEEMIDVGYKMKYFGDGYEEIKTVAGREVISIPIMMGDFLIEKEFGISKGVAGGNFLILAKSQMSALKASEAAVEAIRDLDGVITPFPGGICASGSKVGSKRYKFMHVTTNERFCPTIAGKVKDFARVEGVNAVSEIVIDGTSVEVVKEAMRIGIEVATKEEGVIKISAGNYGGELGEVHISLHSLFK